MKKLGRNLELLLYVGLLAFLIVSLGGIVRAAWDGGTNYPGSLDTATELYDVEDAGVIEDEHHDALAQAIIAVETKIGTGADTPTATDVFIGTGVGTSGWATDLPTAVTIGTGYIYRVGGTDVSDADVVDTLTITNIAQVQDITATAAEINTPLDGASVTLTEFQELETIDATTISAAQWAGLGGATAAGIALWDDAAASNQLVTLGINATASEINTPLDGANVTLTEFQELETIGATTISANQWALLGGVAETLEAAELDLLDGETDLATQSELDTVAALVDTDDEIIDIINASPSHFIDVAAGGTGLGSLTDHSVLVGSGAADVTPISVGATKEVLKGVTGADPDFVTERCFSSQAYTADGNISEAQVVANRYLTNQGDADEADLVLPALSYHVGVIFILEEAQNIEINPPSGEIFDLDGTDLDADDCVDSDSTVGSKISATRMLLADGSTWRWSLDTIRGVWIDTGASD